MTLATTLAGVAVAVSLVAAWVSLHAQREVIRSETVTAVFEGFRRVTELRIASWQVAHVLETPENYERTVAVLRTALADTPPAQVAELLIRERAVAIAVVQIFEESVYQYEHARRLRDRGRIDFLEDVLAYFTERLFLNPRLLWLWKPNGRTCELTSSLRRAPTTTTTWTSPTAPSSTIRDLFRRDEHHRRSRLLLAVWPAEHLDESLTGLPDGAPLLVALGIAFLLGLRHASDPDHLVAVTSLVAAERDGGTRGATRLGVWWGLGHAAILLAVGIPLIALHSRLPAWLESGAEKGIGVIIIALAARVDLEMAPGRLWRRPARARDEPRRAGVRRRR